MQSNLIPFVIPVGLINQLCPQQKNMFTSDWHVIKLPGKAGPNRCFQSSSHRRTNVRWGERKFHNSKNSERDVVISGLPEGGLILTHKGYFWPNSLYCLFFIHWVYIWSVKTNLLCFIVFIQTCRYIKWNFIRAKLDKAPKSEVDAAFITQFAFPQDALS